MNKENFEIDWRTDFVRNLYLKKASETDHTMKYYHYLFPFNKETFGVFNPSFLFTGQNLKTLKNFSYVQLRDGYIPLTIFFENTEPEDIKGKLLIHKDYACLVDKSWLEKVLFYDYESKVQFNKANPPKKIFFAGLLNSTLASVDEIETILDEVVKQLGHEAIKKADIMGFMPSKRNDLWGGWKEENAIAYSKVIFEKLKIDISFPEWGEIQSSTNFKNTLYVELNKGHLIKDSYLMHHVCSKGAGLLNKNESNDLFVKESEMDVSLYHKMNVYSLKENFQVKHSTPALSEIKMFDKIANNLLKDRELNYQWEKWQADYIRKNFAGNN